MENEGKKISENVTTFYFVNFLDYKYILGFLVVISFFVAIIYCFFIRILI